MSMKVLMVTNMYPSADRPGYGAFVKSQIDSLARAGVEVDLYYIPGYRRKLSYLSAPFGVLWATLRRRYDLVHAHYGLSALAARLQFRAPVVVSFCGDDLYGHADESGKATRRSLILAWLHRQSARLMQGVIVKSAAMAELLPSTRAEVTVIPNGVDFERFRPLDRAACRRELGLEQDRVYILFPYDPKRPRKNYAGVKAAVEALNRRSGLDARVLFADGVPNERMPLYMNAADVLVLASFWEGSPNTVKEALACNTRVVAVRVGDTEQLLDGIGASALCDYEPEDIATKLEQVLCSPQPPDGRARSQHLRMERIAGRVLEVYQRVLGRKDTRRSLEEGSPGAS
ncbi:glycosyltransferase [Alkalilimnicola sp. S0819]|uniref:glycosyltransferase n=1 Tax=Alkalilimnicola sp. S0819 TaxID=2613922 RepID=UPI001262430D|nr:glycosyltransferase [Alkalilimnicola sp. S0819]KAB7627887.1 glycosyltransferase family 4 protein [Alkalilimnicola sp. S0819]MPQ15523.1 glycosyltransferase [Alkalilimnicola sp. S0819]